MIKRVSNKDTLYFYLCNDTERLFDKDDRYLTKCTKSDRILIGSELRRLGVIQSY